MARRISASISFMFRELPLPERFAAAKTAGFAGVEIQRLDEGDPPAMARAAAAAGVAVALVNVPMGDYLAGGPGLSGVPGREAEFRAAVEQAFAAAGLLGAGSVHLAPSRIPDGVSREHCLEVYAANAAAALDMAEGRRLSLLLEPMNAVDAPSALFTRIDEAAAFLRERLGGRVGLLFDLYHLTQGGTDPLAAAARHIDLIRHVQFSDVPGRREPGTGRIDFNSAFAALQAAGYDGWYGAEYFPDRPTGETLGWLPGFIGGDWGAP
jgi:hydroxypyruvate isomerase